MNVDLHGEIAECDWLLKWYLNRTDRLEITNTAK